MTDGGRHYRAYIAYSHQDEKWAAWLQHAIERYRLPARMRSSASGAAHPAHLRPVFRDREELSSSSDLSETLLRALRNSEHLIVVCSPAAAASRWVNEEVRRYRDLGRADRILCMVVDGDPAKPESCYPPALFEGLKKPLEPLAADPRPWADGKRLALLKLVAGMLGVGLDELRRRDLQRQRRRRLAIGLAVVLAAALLVLAATSRLAERQAREKAETLATFLIEQVEELQGDVDLATLGRMNRQAMQSLEDIDSRQLTLATRVKLGLALRQLGSISLGQGRYDESIAAYRRSLDLFEELQRQHPDNLQVLYELAQAEYWFGHFYFWQGDFATPREYMARYLEIARQLREAEPDNPRYLLEVAYGTMNMVMLRIGSGEPADEALLRDVEESLRLARASVEALPGDDEALSHYANTLAWAADGADLACDLVSAERYRRENLRLAEVVAAQRPNNETRKVLAYARRGLAEVLLSLGMMEAARESMAESTGLLRELRRRDETNRDYALDLAINAILQGEMEMVRGEAQRANSALQRAEEYFARAPELTALSDYALDAYFDFTVVAAMAGRPNEEARKVARFLFERGGFADFGQRSLALLAYETFRAQGVVDTEIASMLEVLEPETDSAMRSCKDAEISTLPRGFRRPDFIAICAEESLCEP
ncbi:MAG: toll/interleukin-1 receptor domain-containing protein [Gammaproteobacteria bacterium]